NALQILYWGGRIRCGMEENIADLGELRAALSERLPARAQLAGAQLQGIILEGASFAGATFSGADLTGANLTDAAFRNCDLSRVTLRDARTERVVFEEVDLTGADFKDLGGGEQSWTEAVPGLSPAIQRG